MMTFVWFFIGWLVLNWLFTKREPVPDSVPHERGLGPCVMHKWEYENGRLRCTECRKFPGEDT